MCIRDRAKSFGVNPTRYAHGWGVLGLTPVERRAREEVRERMKAVDAIDASRHAHVRPQRGCQRADFEVTLVSAADHIDMRRRYVKRLQMEEVSERLPDADVLRLRTELEGVGRGVGKFTQQRERYLQLAASAKAENRVLLGFSDGALSEDGRVGAYGLSLIHISEPTRP